MQSNELRRHKAVPYIYEAIILTYFPLATILVVNSVHALRKHFS